MKLWFRMLTPALLAGSLALAAPAGATDQDGGGDCSRDIIMDWADAPEGVLAYPGVIGAFPTCRTITMFSSQELPPGCEQRSVPPGPSGHLFHRQGTGFGFPSFWLGCYPAQGGGIDHEEDAKMNQPAQGVSFCAGTPTDCVESAFGLQWDQDECFGDGSDAGLAGDPALAACLMNTVTFSTTSCGPQPVFLNILIDLNRDGDWNDAVLCGDKCAYEWAVKNEVITLPQGCATIASPPFLVGPLAGPAWMRISLTQTPVFDDFPWAGGAGHSGYAGGETEDYPVEIVQAVPARPSTWGQVKSTYR